MRWHRSWRADPRGRRVADRHYNRQNPDSKQFVPPGRCVVLLTGAGDALWVTSWPDARYVLHRWAGAWVNSLFRNEAPDRYLSSELIREALAATAWVFGSPPALGMVTFVDRSKVRGKRHFGLCYRKAGFEEDGFTVDQRLLALRIQPDAMPSPLAPIGAQLVLGDAA